MDAHCFPLKFLGREVPAYYVTTFDAARDKLDELLGDDLIAIDTETRALDMYKMIPEAGLSPHLSCVRLIQMYDHNQVVVFDLDRIGDDKIFVPFLEKNQFIAHYGLFDLQFFKRMGVKNMNLGCTQILARLIYSAAFPDGAIKSASLESLMKSLFGIDINKASQTSDWSGDLTFEQVEYAAFDPLYCMAIAEALVPGLNKYGLGAVYQVYKKAQHPLAEMQINGIRLNQDLHREMIDKWRIDLYDAKTNLTENFGLKAVTPTGISEWLTANLSEREIADWPRTDTGMLSTAAKTLEDYEHLEIVAPFAEFQKKKTLSSTFGSALLQRLNPATKRLHSRYNIAGARTGRLSSSEPNLQNFPHDPAMRAIFIPQEGFTFVGADYSQIEVRVAAELSDDPVLKGIFERGEDIYRFTASQVYHCRIEDVTDAQRKSCKPLVLGNLYGIGVKKYAKSVGIEEDEARRQVLQFHSTYKVLREWQLERAREAEDTCQARTVMGKVRALDPDNTYGAGMNVPVQGTSAEIMLIALDLFCTRIKEAALKALLVNCVHDDILSECPHSEVPYVKEILEESMILGYKKVIPDGCIYKLVNVGSGPDWGQAK